MYSVDKLPNPSINGLMMEKQKGMVNNHDLIDDMVNKIELKSCEEWVKDYKNGMLIRRRGRFHFYKEQHDYLVSIDGYYLLVVHNTGDIIMEKTIKAKDLDFKISINWKRLF